MQQHDIKVRYAYEGTYNVVAEARDEADRQVRENGGLGRAGERQTAGDDNEVTDWNFRCHPDMQILSFTERGRKGRNGYTAMCFSGRIEELRKDIIESIRQLLYSHGLKELTFTGDDEDPVWVIRFDKNGDPHECRVTGLKVTDSSLTVFAWEKESGCEVDCSTPYELGASNCDWLNQMYDADVPQLDQTNGNS